MIRLDNINVSFSPDNGEKIATMKATAYGKDVKELYDVFHNNLGDDIEIKKRIYYSNDNDIVNLISAYFKDKKPYEEYMIDYKYMIDIFKIGYAANKLKLFENKK